MTKYLKKPEEIKLVRQTDKYDCVPACLSMVTGIDLMSVKRDFYGLLPATDASVMSWLVKHNIYAAKEHHIFYAQFMPNSVYLGTILGDGGDKRCMHSVVVSVIEQTCVILDPCKTRCEVFKGGTEFIDVYRLYDCSGRIIEI